MYGDGERIDSLELLVFLPWEYFWILVQPVLRTVLETILHLGERYIEAGAQEFPDLAQPD